jgi:mRNA interferase MazF
VPYVPDAAHVIKIDLDPLKGHEQGGWRPAIVLSTKSYNGKTGLLVAVPVTSQIKGYPFEVPLPAQMKTTGVVLVDQIKNLDWRQRRAHFVETAPSSVVKAILERVAILVGLPSK